MTDKSKATVTEQRPNELVELKSTDDDQFLERAPQTP